MDRQLASELEFHFRNHNDEALRLATRLVGGADRGEDVVMSVWARLAALMGRTATSPASLEERPRAYVLRAVRNMAADHLAQLRRDARHRVEIEDIDQLSIGTIDAAEILYQRHKIAVLAVAINGLPADCRRAFILSRLHGRPYREIAATLGVSVSMIEKHIVRALRECRAGLVEAGY